MTTSFSPGLLSIKKSLCIVAAFGFSGLLLGTLLGHTALAGGTSDDSTETEFYEPEAPFEHYTQEALTEARVTAATITADTAEATELEATPAQPEQTHSLHDHDWQETRTGESVCREAEGNVICLESGLAENARW